MRGSLGPSWGPLLRLWFSTAEAGGLHGDPRPRGVGNEQVLAPSFCPLSGAEQRVLWVQLWTREGPRTSGQNAHTQEAPMRQARGGQLTRRQEASRMPAGCNTAKCRTRVESKAWEQGAAGRPALRRGAGARLPSLSFQLYCSRRDSENKPDCRVRGSRGARPQTGSRGRVQTTQLSEQGRTHRLTAPHTWSESRVPQLKERLPS